MINSVDFHCESNNAAHRTSEITTKQLMVRRGQSFLLTLEMMKPFTTRDPLSLTVETGSSPSVLRHTAPRSHDPNLLSDPTRFPTRFRPIRAARDPVRVR